MDKKDLLYVVAALGIILIVAVVVKPIMTGHPVNTGISAQSTTIPTDSPDVSGNATLVLMSPTPVTPPLPTATSSPIPTRPTGIQTIGFVNPTESSVSPNADIPRGTRIDSVPVNMSRTTIAKITGKFSGQTTTVNIPYPYWELVYTVNPSVPAAIVSYAVTPTMGEGSSISGIQGSYSTANPSFSIAVMDATDPNRIVRTITPPGGVDLALWTGTKKTVTNPEDFRSNQLKTVSTDTINLDPRPWTEKFYEGQRSYYFIINAHGLDSYELTIQVPSTYIGQY